MVNRTNEGGDIAHQLAPKIAKVLTEGERGLLGDIERVFGRVEDGDPVEFIHGGAGDGMNWNRAIERLLAGNRALPRDLPAPLSAKF